MQFEGVVLIVIGAFGLILGTLGLAARPDVIGIIMGVLVFGMGCLSLWLGWLYFKDRFGGTPSE